MASHFSPSCPKPVSAEKVSDWIGRIPHLVAIAFYHPIPDKKKYSYQCHGQQPKSPVEVQDTCGYHYCNSPWKKMWALINHTVAIPFSTSSIQTLLIFSYVLLCILKLKNRAVMCFGQWLLWHRNLHSWKLKGPSKNTFDLSVIVVFRLQPCHTHLLHAKLMQQSLILSSSSCEQLKG